MQTIVLPHLPQHPLQVALFANVENATFLRQQLLEGNTDFEYAFVDASIVLSRAQVLAACFRAITDAISGRLKSRNVHSEIVFSLSTNNNIGDSFRRFGISEHSESVLVIKVGKDAVETERHLNAHVKGRLVPFTDAELFKAQDVARISKAYRLSSPKKGETGALGRRAEAFVVGSMALKGS